MARNRGWNTLLGVLLGLIPFANILAAVIMSFSRRRIGLGIFFLILGGITVISIKIIRNVETQEVLLKELWEPTFQQTLASEDIHGEDLREDDFEKAMFNVLDKSSKELMEQYPQLIKAIPLNSDGYISIDNSVYEYFKRACHNINFAYWHKVEEKTGNTSIKNARKVPFAKTDEEKNFISEEMNVFFHAYLNYKFRIVGTFFGALFTLCCIAGLIGCVALGRNMGAADPPSFVYNATNYRNNTIDSGITDQNESTVPPPVIPGEKVSLHVNVNTANEDELARLPGINRVLAKSIIAERRRNGYYVDIYDLERRMEFNGETTGTLMLLTSFEVSNDAGTPESNTDTDKSNGRGTGRGRIIEY